MGGGGFGSRHGGNSATVTPENSRATVSVSRVLRSIRAASGGDPAGPSTPHAAMLGLYGAFVAATVVAGRLRGVRPPERLRLGDTVLLSVATHKASRLLSKDTVTSPLREPFTRTERSTGMGEVAESPRGTGLRRALGELLTCPFCLGVWVATGLTAGMVLAPRTTRLVATALTAVTASDVLQLAYDAARTGVQRS
jgi:hypothetical protein